MRQTRKAIQGACPGAWSGPGRAGRAAHTPACRVRRLCQARLRQRGEQYVAEAGRSTPTVHACPHCGHSALRPACTASVRARIRRPSRQLRERHFDEQNTAVAFAFGINGSPHPRHNRGPAATSTDATSRSRGALFPVIPAPYARRRQMGSALVEVAQGRVADDHHNRRRAGQPFTSGRPALRHVSAGHAQPSDYAHVDPTWNGEGLHRPRSYSGHAGGQLRSSRTWRARWRRQSHLLPIEAAQEHRLPIFANLRLYPLVSHHSSKRPRTS